MSDIDEFRAEFEAIVSGMDTLSPADDPHAEKYNELADALRLRVAEWGDQGLVGDILRPLLDSTDLGVRATAAGFMLRHGEEQRCLSILRELADNFELGNVSARAEAMLMGWQHELRKK